MDSKNTYRPYGALFNLSLIGLVLMHIVNHTWVRYVSGSDLYSYDWRLANFTDTVVRPSLPILMFALGAMAREYRKEENRLCKKLVSFAPFLVASAVYIFIYGRYDKQPFDFEIAGMLFTRAYPYYWVPLAVIYLLASPFCLWLNSRKSGASAMLAYMVLWFVFAVAIPSIYSYSAVILKITPHWMKYVVDTVDKLMTFKLSGFFLVGLLYSECLLKTEETKKNTLLNVLMSPYALLVLYAIAMCFPVLEIKYDIHPFNHSLRDYTKLHQALLGFVLYLQLTSAAVKMKKTSEFLAGHGSVITGLYLVHSALIEGFARWVPSVPIAGLLMKTAALMILGILFGIVYNFCERCLTSEKW